MTEEEVVMVNERREASENGGGGGGGDDQSKIKGEHCNGGGNVKENEEVVVVNGEVCGKIYGEFVGGSDGAGGGGDSGASDLVAVVDDNVGGAGAAYEGLQEIKHKVNGDGEGVGESRVAVTEAAAEAECECDVVKSKENDSADASAVSNGSAGEEIREKEISNGAFSVDADVVDGEDVVPENELVAVEQCVGDQNGSRSVTEDKEDSDTTVVEEGVVDVIKIHDHEVESVVVKGEDVKNGVAEGELSENDVPGEVNGFSVSDDSKIQDQKFESEVDVADVQKGIENEICDDSNGAQEWEIIGGDPEASGDQKDVGSVEEEVADMNKSHSGFESVADQNSLREVTGVPVVVDRAQECENIAVDAEASRDQKDVGSVVEEVDVNKSQSEFESVADQNGLCVENEVSEVPVFDRAHESKNIAGDAESSGDQKDVGSVVEEVADVNKSRSEFESIADQNGLAVVDGVSATDVKECADEGDHQNSSGEKAQIESVDSGGGEEMDGGTVDQERSESVPDADVDRSLESESIVGADVSDEKDIAANESQDGELKSAVGADVENGLADTQLGECTEKNSISVDVDGVSARTDVKERADEDVQNSLEKAQIESVTDTYVDKSIVDVDIQNGLAEPEQSESAVEEVPVEGESGSKLERSEELGHELVSDREELLATNSTDMTGGGNVLSDLNGNEVESKGEPSAVEREAEPSAVEREAEPSALEREAEPSAVENEAEPSALEREAEPSSLESEAKTSADISEMENIAVESEAEPSADTSDMKNIAVESEAEPSAVEIEAEPSADTSDMKNIAVESESEPSAVENEAEPSADMSDMKNIAVEREAEPSNNAVENDGEPSVEGELSLDSEGSKRGDGDLRPTQEGSTSDTLDGQHVGSEVVRRPFYYLIRIPRYDDDENMKEHIKNALQQVEEKTKSRDAIRVETQAKKASCKECSQDVRAAISEERAARDLLKSKRQEMDAVQSKMNRLTNAISVGDIDDKIKNMEHMIQHETLPLKEEKQLIRQIKQLKQNREELSSNMGKQDQSQQSLDSTDSIEDHFMSLQLLKKEVELLRNNVLKTEAVTKAARKKYDDESNKLSDLLARFKAADDIRQEAYAKLQTLRKQLHEKNKYFWEYKNAAKKGRELAAEGNKEELQCFCVDQVERLMDLWKKNDEFRKDYIRCNTRSTLRRLQTLDGRSLGPDEEPPVIPNAITEKTTKNNPLISRSTPEQEKKSTSTESVNIKDEPVPKVAVQKSEKNQIAKAKKKPAKPAPSDKSIVSVPRWGDEPEDTIEEPVRTKEEQEALLKAEKARKEEEAAKLKENRRLEEIEKAKEAMLRKKRNAEKAQQRAALKAQKEAEQKEKEREKRARKKERRKAASTDPAESAEQEPAASSSETLTRSTEEIEQSEKPVEVTKRAQKPSQFTRQTKSKSVPLPLRNRGKRRIQPWMWVLIAVLVVVALFCLGNSSSLRSWLQETGF